MGSIVEIVRSELGQTTVEFVRSELSLVCGVRPELSLWWVRPQLRLLGQTTVEFVRSDLS